MQTQLRGSEQAGGPWGTLRRSFFIIFFRFETGCFLVSRDFHTLHFYPTPGLGEGETLVLFFFFTRRDRTTHFLPWKGANGTKGQLLLGSMELLLSSSPVKSFFRPPGQDFAQFPAPHFFPEGGFFSRPCHKTGGDP